MNLRGMLTHKELNDSLVVDESCDKT